MNCLFHTTAARPSAELLARAARLKTSYVSDVMDRSQGARGINLIAGLRPGAIVAGPAFTVKTREGDNLVLHKALELAQPGDIIVVDAGGYQDRALLGGLMGSYAAKRGIAAIVIDGAVRDKNELDQIGMPIFARGLNHLGPYKDGPGEIGGTIAVGGLVVSANDIVLCDEDGVTSLPSARAAKIIADAEAKAAAEEREEMQIRDGSWDRSWIETRIRSVYLTEQSS